MSVGGNLMAWGSGCVEILFTAHSTWQFSLTHSSLASLLLSKKYVSPSSSSSCSLSNSILVRWNRITGWEKKIVNSRQLLRTYYLQLFGLKLFLPGLEKEEKKKENREKNLFLPAELNTKRPNFHPTFIFHSSNSHQSLPRKLCRIPFFPLLGVVRLTTAVCGWCALASALHDRKGYSQILELCAERFFKIDEIRNAMWAFTSVAKIKRTTYYSIITYHLT